MAGTAPATASYVATRARLTEYFDRSARQAWIDLTSDAPVSGVRATVRAGRDRMRETLLSWLPADLSGRRLLDAGCGTGALAIEAARRGAEVVGVDLSEGLVGIARERTPPTLADRVTWLAGDMLAAELGCFDHVVCMDSLIHYPAEDIARALGVLAGRTRHSILFTFAPRTPLLATMHAMGKLFPRGDRSPMIAPVARSALADRLLVHDGWALARDRRVTSGFYVSHAAEWVHAA
ncbi:MAG: magnesium protoporphyrin IX methyltransferase [Sphingomonadaceae bacterium]